MRTREFIVAAMAATVAGLAGVVVAGTGTASGSAARAAAATCTTTSPDKGSLTLQGPTGSTAIPVTSVGFPITGAQATGKASVGDVTVTAPLDANGPALFRNIVTGGHLKQATVKLTCNGSAGLIYDLTDVTIGQLTTTWKGGRPAEQIGLHFVQVTITQKAGGTVCFNPAKNALC